jgi:hypothetical protein
VTTSDAVTNAVSAEKLRNDYTPNWYSIDLSGTTITAVYTSTGLGDGTNLMNDVARLLGTIYEKGKENFNATSSIKTITFNNVEYTWKTEDIGGQSVLEGSNWRDASNNTLVSALVTYYGQHSGTDSVVLKINDTDYTFAVKVGVAKIGTTTYDTLEAAVTAASSGATIELQSDITLTNTTLHIMKDLTIDLNGHDITAAARALWVKSGTLTLTGNGIVSSSLNDKESSVIRVGNNDSNTYEQNQASQIAAGLVVGKNVTVSGPGCYGVTAFGSLTQETVEISGKVSGLSGFGTNGNDKYNAAKLTLTSTGVIESTATDGSATSDSAGYAMYLPAPGKYEINGTVTGYGGICIKSGQCDISIGSTAIIKATGTAGYAGAAKSVTGTGDKDGSTWYTNGNGPATAGYAIAVENNAAYAGGTTVKIAGGSITGALTIYDDYGGDAKGTTLSNKGTITITGGTFSTDPTAFVNTSSYKVTGGGPYTVSKIVYSAPTTTTTPTVTTNEDGSTTTTTTKTENGATVTTATDKDANGNVTGSTETKEEKKSDGSTVTTETKKDADGKVTQTTETTVAKDTTTNTTTETSKTENADGTKTTETVKKVDENNKVLSETTKETEVDKEAEQQKEVLTEKKEDGSVVKTTTTSSTKEGDQSATIVEEKAAENS